MSARRRDAGRPVAAVPPRWIAPPPLTQHLREFAVRRDAWLILARNVVPVVGIYAFHWSAALAVFNYWFDGLVALVAIIAALVPRALRESQPKSAAAQGMAALVFKGILTWLFLVALIGLPYWIVLVPLQDLLLDGKLGVQFARSPGLWLTFAMLAGSQFWKAFHAGYDAMPENDLKQRVRWDAYLLILRAIAMFAMASHGLAFVMVPLMALLLSYFEIWPERALGAVFGDPGRLYEYDPGKD